MNRTSRNTAAVLVLTLFTVIAVFATVQLVGRIVGTPNASAQTTAAQGPGAASSAGATQQDPYGYGQGSSGTLTCPSTGCTASTCHASQ